MTGDNVMMVSHERIAEVIDAGHCQPCPGSLWNHRRGETAVVKQPPICIHARASEIVDLPLSPFPARQCDLYQMPFCESPDRDIDRWFWLASPRKGTDWTRISRY